MQRGPPLNIFFDPTYFMLRRPVHVPCTTVAAQHVRARAVHAETMPSPDLPTTPFCKKRVLARLLCCEGENTAVLSAV
jgi:hypothetical protein